MVLTVVGLHVLGWACWPPRLAATTTSTAPKSSGSGPGRSRTRSGCATHSTRIIYRRSTTPPQATQRRATTAQRRVLFSLGHSTVVFALAVLLNFGIRGLDNQVSNKNSSLQHTTNIIGTSVSAFFLLLIAALNVIILIGILRIFREMRTGIMTTPSWSGN